MNSDLKIKELQVEATIIRADGTVEELGVVSSWTRNPFRRFWRQFKARI